MIHLLLSLYIIQFTTASRRLLQTISNPGSILPNNQGGIPVVPFNPGVPQLSPALIYGYWGQQCLPITPDMACQTVGQILTDAGTGTVECSVPSSCCVCQQVYCGYDPSGQPCDTIAVGADNALYGVKQVAIKGEVDGSGAVMDCGGSGSCAETYIIGEWVNTMICGGPDGCRESTIELTHSKGLVCGTRSCIGATVNLAANRGGAVSCEAPQACMNSIMNVDGMIENIKCGDQGCKGAYISLTNPMEHFHLTCGGQEGCYGLTLDLIITGPAATTGCPAIVGQPDVIEWKGITCGSLTSCVGLTLNVINNGCRPVRIEDFNCGPGQSCTGSNFNFNAGSSPYPMQLQNCMCGPSCRHSTGIDLCFNNVHILECLDYGVCSNTQQVITNIANDFLLSCPTPGVCADFSLTLDISGASQNLITRIAAFDCSGYGGCANLNVDIRNHQVTALGAPVEIVVEDIICPQGFSCDGATFITGDYVTINNVFCSFSDSCTNCWIKRTIDDPNPQPCDPNADQKVPSPPLVPEPEPIVADPVAPAIIDPVNPNGAEPLPVAVDPVPSTGLDPAGPAVVDPANSNPADPVPPEAPSTPIEPVANPDPVAVDPSTPADPTINAVPADPAGPIIPDIPSIPAVEPPPTEPQPPAVNQQQIPAVDPPIPPIPDLPVPPPAVGNNNPPITPSDPVPPVTDPISQSPAVPNTDPLPAVADPQIPPLPPIPAIPELPIPPPAVGNNPPIDVPQNGGSPAPPQVDQVPGNPVADPVIPAVQTGGIVIESGNTNNQRSGSNAIIPPLPPINGVV